MPVPLDSEDDFRDAGSDLVTYSLEGPLVYDRDAQLYIDSEDTSKWLSANHVTSLVRRLVAGLRAVGLEEGDGVLLHLPNNVLYSALFHGIVGAGGCFMGSNPAYHVEELEPQVRLANPKIIVTSKALLPTVQQATRDAASSGRIFVLDTDATVAAIHCRAVDHQNGAASANGSSNGASHHAAAGSWNDFNMLLSHGESDWSRISDERVAKSRVAALWATSGTSGPFKVAAASHHALICQNIASQATVKNFKVVKFISLPFFHMFGAGLVHIDPLRRGEPLYVMERFQPEQYVHMIARYSVTETAMAPAMMVALVKSTLPLKKLFSSLRIVTSGGGVLDPRIQQQLYEILHPEAAVLNLWGMTEVGIMTTFQWPQKDASGSVGSPVLGVQMRLLDDNGRIITADDIPGEAHCRSPQQMMYYVNNPKATSEALDAEGWCRTGDVAFVRDGKYYVVDRKKDLIKVRGWQVAPAEMEMVLRSHPEIAEAAVVGVVAVNESGVSEEIPKAFVVRRNGDESTLTPEDVYNYARERLVGYKALTGGVVFMDSLPKTASGKVQRNKLRDASSTGK